MGMSVADPPEKTTPTGRHSHFALSQWTQWAALAIFLLAVAGWISVLRPVWASQPDLADRFLIPLTSLWLIYRSWPTCAALPRQPLAAGLLVLLVGTAAFSVGWFVAVQVAGRPIVVWWLTLALILMGLGLTLALAGGRQARLLIFPLLFIVFSLPTPGRVYRPLQDRLQRFTTKAAEVVLPLAGVEVVRPDPNAFELTLKSGSLGVVEACSGVRSITALTAIAVLVAYLRGFSLWRGGVLIALTLAVVAISNAIRVIVTGLLQEYLGRAFIEGWYHDALGIGAILVGLALIMALSHILAPKNSTDVDEPHPQAADATRPAVSMAALVILAAGLAVCLWSEQFRLDHRVFVRWEELPKTIGQWQGEDLEIPPLFLEELMCDQVVRRDYVNSLGQRIQVWVMFWGSAATTANRHHPDICYPWRGWTITNVSNKVPPLRVDGVPDGIAPSVRHYSKPDEEQILFFWTQHGRYVLPEGIEPGEHFSGHSWIFKLFQGFQPIDQGARLSILLGTHSRGSPDLGNQMMHEFASQLANELYRVCPQLRPERPTAPAGN
jgi:exosortase